MTIEEKKETCSKALIAWFSQESNNVDLTKHDEDIADLFTSRVLLKKFEVFGIDIILPDALLLILHICVNNNPGQIQIVLKDLLNSIKNKIGPIPSGYIIKSSDFTDCFPWNFPIMEIPEINDKYESLWNNQKIIGKGPGSDNLCDTVDWWKEVMK